MNNKHFSLTVLTAVNPRSRPQQMWRLRGEGGDSVTVSLLAILPCPHLADGARSWLGWVPFRRALILFMGAPPS